MDEQKKIECRVLASAFYGIEAVNLILDRLTEKDFTTPETKAVYLGITILYRQDVPVKVETILDQLAENGLAPKPVTANFLLEVESLGRTFYLESLIDRMLEASRIRCLQSAAKSIYYLVSEGEESAQIKDNLDKILDQMDASRSKTHFNLEEIIEGTHRENGESVLENLEKRRKCAMSGKIYLDGISTGYDKLDEMLSGFVPGHLVIIGARPGVGKSTFCINLAKKMAEKGIAVGLFSLEMSAEEVTRKILTIESGVDLENIKQGTMTDYDMKYRIPQALLRMRNYKDCLFIDDQPSLTAEKIRSRAKRMIYSHGVKVIMIDHCSEIKNSVKQDRKDLQIRHSTQILRDFAKTAEVPIVMACQLNRESSKSGKQPSLHDLRDSGSLEELAAEVMLLHRWDIENPDEKPGQVRLIVAKNRFGRTGYLDMYMQPSTGEMGLQAKLEPYQEEEEEELDAAYDHIS